MSPFYSTRNSSTIASPRARRTWTDAQFRPDDLLLARGSQGRIVGLGHPDEIEEVRENFDEWLNELAPITKTGDSRRLVDRIVVDVQTVADLIRWVEPYLTKKAKGAGIRDDDIR